MANYVAITLPDVLAVKDIINREILETASGVSEDVWEKLGIVLKTGIENMETSFVFDGNNNVAAPKYHGSELASTLGEMLQRRLIVKPVWSRLPDSLDNYREKEPISIATLSEKGVTGEHIQFQLLQAGKQTSSQVRRNLFLGSRPTTKAQWEALSVSEREYTLFDGYYKKIENMKIGATPEDDCDAAGNPLISAEKGNLIATDPILGAATPQEAYDAVVDFYNQLDSHLISASVVYFYVSEQLFQRVKQGYNLKYHGMQTPDVNKPEFRFTDLPNVEFRHDAILGVGDMIIATVEDNLHYGTDISTDGEPSNAHISIMQDQNDAHNIIIQIDLAAGTRVLDPTKGRFAVNDQKNYCSVEDYKKSLMGTDPQP